jgi:hypothetical protein
MVAEPPALIKSKGIPVTGMIPMAIPTFSNAENANIARTPAQRYVPKASFETWAILQIR